MHNYGHWKKTLALLVMSALSLGASSVDAMPEGGVVRSGSGSVTQNGKEMTIRQDSGRLAMDWTGFSVGKDETVRFQQPGKDALALNRVTGNQQSVIDGSLLSNGHVLLVNPNGVVIGKNASIDVGGLVASTAQVKDNFMKEFGNSTGAFSLGGVSDGKIINEGTIKAEGGLVALHAAKVENSGTISNTGGSAVLAAADTLTLTPDADGKLNFTVDGKAAEASALNKGAITADGGTIVMTADSASDVMSTVVNNSGTLQARTLRKNEKGQILLEGGDKGQVEVSGTLDASGTEEGQSAGNIKVIGEKTIVHDGTNLLARGAIDGGKIETSGDVLNLGDNLNIDAKGVNGKAGEWLLDPLDVIIADKDPTTTSNYDKADKKTAADSDFTKGSASIGYNDPAATDANVSSVNSAVTWISTDMVENMLNGGTSVTVQAAATNGNANIIVSNDIDKTAGGDATFTLDAMRNITINGNISSTSNKLNVVLNADSNGDKIGAVIINGNINTNGGDFTSASGGDVTYTSDEAKTKGYGKGTLKGKAEPAGHTVGTYFGHVNEDGTADGKKDDRLIQTKGGKITLNGEIAIGLNGGTLTLDSNGGAVTATGIINSGNSYGAYVYGTDTWNTLVEQTVEDYLKRGTVPAYHYQGVNYVKDTKGNYVKNKDGTYQYTTDAQNFSNGQPHYTFSEADTQNVRWLGDGSSTSVSTSAGTGYASVVIAKGSMTLEQWLNYQLTYNAANFAKRYISQSSGVKVVTTTRGGKTTTSVQNSAGKTMTTADLKSYLTAAVESFTKGTASTDTTLNGQTLYANIKDDISHLLATNWFASKELAQGNTKGGSAAGDSYLATITTILENSLTTPNGQQILWAGGRGSGVLNKKGSNNSTNDKLYPYSFYGMPDDPTYQDGMYWVTGPEGEANGGKGTQFYSNAGSNWQSGNYGKAVYGYVNWDTYKDGNKIRSQPDNSAPFLTVGFGTTGEWDDAAMGGDTTVGFIKETNLANSSLNIKAGSGTVNLEGDLGKAKALDTVNIESTGAVTVGTDNNNVTDYYHGTIYVDHGLYISGNGVKVGGEIHSGGTDVEATRNTDSSFSDYLDNVTINSAGNLTVHGIEVNASTDPSGNTTSRTDGKGGKIKLTSTGTEGVITLGDGVDYNGKNTNGGVLKAVSTAQGAVVIDAQGSNGGFVNKTSAKKAIVTGEKGTWQIYSASPDKDTFKTNLNSETDAEWTAKSNDNANDTNNSGKTMNVYGTTDSTHTTNKYIFQTTPTITLYVEDHEKTYGDDITNELQSYLKSREEFTGLDKKIHNVNEFTDAFREKEYTNYISVPEGQTITVTSVGKDGADGAVGTATRTNGNYEATDKQKAIYDLNVNLNGAEALDGYALNKENAKLEIKRKTLTINTNISQTYGNDTPTLVTPSDYQNQLVGKDTLSADDITYAISSTGKYAPSKGTSGTTAHVGTYAGEYLTTGAKVKDGNGNDASANYEVSGSGTITVNPADLVLQLKDVSTTYGQKFDEMTYGYNQDTDYLKGLLKNGDDASVITDNIKNDAIHYINTGAVTDADKNTKRIYTANAGANYTISSNDTVSLQDYNVTFAYGNSTVNKAKLKLKVNDAETIYGTPFKPETYGYTLEGNTNGDSVDEVKADGIIAFYANDGAVTDADKNTKQIYTKDANGDYHVKGDFTLTGQTAKNYEIETNTPGKATVNKATVKVKLNDVSTTYGTAFDTDKYGYDPSKIEGLTNGDKTDVVTQVLNGDYKTGNIQYTNTGDASAEEKLDGKVTKTVNGGPYYLQGTTSQTLGNYNIEIEDGNADINKATLHLSTGDYKVAYGAADEVTAHLRNATTVTNKTAANGDSLEALVVEIGIKNTSDALLKEETAPGTGRTADVKYKADGKTLDSYAITTDFKKSLDNYNVVLDKAGSIKLTPIAIKVTNEMVQTYGSTDKIFKEVSMPSLVNGDTISTDGLTMKPKAGGAYETNRAGRTTADAGTYYNDLESDGGGIVHENGNDARKNYSVTIEGDIIVNPKDITTRANGTGSTLNNLSWDVKNDSLANGDVWGKDVLFDKTYGDMISYADRTFGVKSFIDGKQISDGTQIGNYIYHPTGIVQLTFNPIVKPDVWAHSGGYRPRNKIETSLPIFRVEDAKVGQYGTYGVEHNKEGDRLVLSATGMRLPEPDQVPDEERTFTTTLSTETGSGTFKLVYNGVSLKVYPQDKEAEETVRAGDKTKNVSLSEKALYVGYTEMGLDLIDLKGVYIYFN